VGLDMCLDRFPLVRGTVGGRKRTLTPKNFNAVDSWIEYQEYLKKPLREDETEKCKWEEWSGNSEYLPDEETLKELEPYMHVRYWFWDIEHNYPHTMINEQVGYWRKANAIHNWFVENIQDGEDDCDYHRPITECDLEDLRDTCQEVLDSLGLVDGKVANGYTIDENMQKVYNYEDGMVATNTELAEELLPSCSGFFFGSTDYDEYYAEDLKDTIDICNKVLETTDFTKQQIFYCSSW